jgi:hypothetical protein
MDNSFKLIFLDGEVTAVMVFEILYCVIVLVGGGTGEREKEARSRLVRDA